MSEVLGGRELKLLGAAMDVLARWALIRATGGELGACGLPGALDDLSAATDLYPEIEPETTEDSPS